VDWNRFESEATDLVVAAVTRRVSETPGERFYAAALHSVYREELGTIGLPSLALHSAAADNSDAVRLDAHPCDWHHSIDGWCPRSWASRWQAALMLEATAVSMPQWHATFDHYLTSLVRVCTDARTALHARDETQQGFLVVVVDEQHHEPLLRRCLTETQLAQHFPAVATRAAARARVAALPAAGRAEYFARLLGSFDGPITSEDAQIELTRMGSASFPVLIGLLSVDGHAWLAAKLLADIGRADHLVVRKLAAALTTLSTEPDRTWVACALSRLQRFDIVLAHTDRLTPETIAAAIAAPLKGFRDHAVNPPLLTYRHIEGFLNRYPAYTAAVAAELAAGTALCSIAAEEVDEALRGLNGLYALIRCHAATVLGDGRLGPQVAARSLPALRAARRHDPDPDVRRQAELSIAALELFEQ